MKKLKVSVTALVVLLTLVAGASLLRAQDAPAGDAPKAEKKDQGDKAAKKKGPPPSSTLTQPRRSPHDTINSNFDSNRVIIVYGRPFSKDPRSAETRKVFGNVVKYDTIWRLGADEATLLITQKPITLGGADVPAGAYSLYMLPSETGTSKLVINKAVGQWGTDYDEQQDLARVDLKTEKIDPAIDQLTISMDRNPEGGGTINIKWENSQFSVPFKVK